MKYHYTRYGAPKNENNFHPYKNTLKLTFKTNTQPDITIGTEGKSYNKIYESVSHELSHASHFTKVGSEYWATYVSYIMTYGAYGDGTGKNAQLCGIGEMWGFFMGCHLAQNKTGNHTQLYPYKSTDEWIHPQIFWDIYKNSHLSKREIFECLTLIVDTYDELAYALYNKIKNTRDRIYNSRTPIHSTPRLPTRNPPLIILIIH